MLLKGQSSSINWEYYNYLQYLKSKQAIEENTTTLIPEEKVTRDSSRPTLYNRCLLGDGTSTIDLSSGIAGTLTLKGWTKEGGVWAYRDITTGLVGTTLTLQSSVYYKSIDRLVNGVKRDTAVCEEGAGLILYTNLGDELPVTTADINVVRTTQDDAPLLPLSGDYVGASQNRAVNITNTYQYWNFNAYATSEGILSPRLSPTGNAVDLNFQPVHQIVLGGRNPTGSGTYGFLEGAYTDGNSNPQVAPTQGIVGDNYVIYKDRTLNGDSRFIITINGTYQSADIRVKGEVIEGEIYNIETRDSTLWNNFTADVTNVLGESVLDITNMQQFSWALDADNYTGLGYGHADGANYPATQLGWVGVTCADVRALLTGVLTNFDDWLTKMVTKVNVGGLTASTNHRFFLTKSAVRNLSIGVGTFDEVITTDIFVADGNLGGTEEIGYFNIYDRQLDSYETINFDNRTIFDRVHIEFELPISIEEQAVVPKDKDNNYDAVFQQPLKYSGRKDFPLTPVDEPCFDTNNGDYATLTSPLSLGATNVVQRFEVLFNNYNSSRMVMGDSANANRAFGFQFNDVMALHVGASVYEVDCGLNLASKTEPFIGIWEWYHDGLSTTQGINFYITEVNGTILFSSLGNTLSGTGYIANLDTIGNKGGVLGDPVDADIVYIKYYQDSVLQNQWEYMGNNSLVMWDRVNGNHATITTADITANQGTQNVYSSRLKDGWSEELYFDGTAKVEAASNTVQDETTGDFTLLAWVCLIDNSSDASVDDDQGLISKISIGPNVNGYALYLGSGTLRAEFVSSTTRYTTPNMTYDLDVNQNKWHLCAARFDRDGNLSATVVQPDGTIETQIIDISSESGNSITNTETFTLGNYFQFVDRDFFGFMSQAAKFSSLLTDAELTELHTQGKDYSFENNVGGYVSSANLTGHWIAPSDASSDWVDTQGNGNLSPTNVVKEKIPASLTTPTQDVLGNTLTYQGGKLQGDLKLSLPEYKTHTVALESNEDKYREVNGVKDRLLIPISLNHSDKGFPAFKNSGTDYGLLASDVTISDADVIEVETLVTDYPAQGDHCILGWSDNNNNFIGFNGASSMIIKNGGNFVLQSTGLNLSTVNQFRAKWKFTRVSSSSTTNTEFYIYDLSGNTLFEYTGGSMSGALSNLDLLYKGEASSKYFVGTAAWTKFTRNNILEHYWVYTGNNSLLLQDKVGGNHGILTTADVTANQGTQNVYNPFVDGFNKTTNFDGSYSLLTNTDPSIAAITIMFRFIVYQNSTGADWILNLESTQNGWNVFGVYYDTGKTYITVGNGVSSTITLTVDTTLLRGEEYTLFSIFDSSTIKGRIYNSSGVATNYTTAFTGAIRTSVGTGIEIGRFDSQYNQFFSGYLRHYRCWLAALSDAECDTEFASYNAVRQTNLLQELRLDGGLTDSSSNETDATTATGTFSTIKLVPKHPYNEQDVFGNTLTTPRTKAVTKAIKYTE